MRRFYRSSIGLLQIYIQESLAYRASAFIWVLTDGITGIVMPLVWIAAAGSGQIAGFTGSDFVQYYLSILLVSSIVTSHFMWEIAYEIRDGIFSAHIVRPVNYFHFIACRNLAWRLVRTSVFLPLFVVFVWVYREYLVGAEFVVSWEFFLALLLGHVLSLTFCAALGMLALFFQEAQSVFDLYYIPMMFLGGQLFPLALFPDWVRGVASFFPFYAMTAFPTEVLIGRIQGEAVMQGIFAQLWWIAGTAVAYAMFWRFGTRYYNGIGM